MPTKSLPHNQFAMLRRPFVKRGLLFAALVSVAFIYYVYETYQPRLDYDLIFYRKDWLEKESQVAPLSDCFHPEKISPRYNFTENMYGARHYEVQAGISLRIGMDCYAFAGTIPRLQHHDTPYIPPNERVQYHVYWRADLAPFGTRQEWMLKSFLATQDIRKSRLTVWSNGDLKSNPILKKYLMMYPDSLATMVADKTTLAKGTKMENSPYLQLTDTRAWIDSDLVRLLILWNYGGVWVDMDMLLTRDLTPLLENEYVTQWDCYDREDKPLNNAFLHFRQHSPYICEAFDIMANSGPPTPNDTEWGGNLLQKVWRRLVRGSIPPFKVLPFCFTDALLCRADNRFPDPFTPDHELGQWANKFGLAEKGGVDQALQNIFAVHLHNRWTTDFPPGGWVQRLLLDRYQKTIDEHRHPALD